MMYNLKKTIVFHIFHSVSENPYYNTFRLSEKTVGLLKTSAPELKDKGIPKNSYLLVENLRSVNTFGHLIYL